MRKMISFDIDTKIAEQILGDYTKIYNHIKRYLKKNDYRWQQGSVYVSNGSVSYQDVIWVVISESDFR